jgi:hypothetical protein
MHSNTVIRYGLTKLTCLRTYLLTYLLTPWSKVLLEKLTGLQLVKQLPAYYGTRRFIAAFVMSDEVRHYYFPVPDAFPHVLRALASQQIAQVVLFLFLFFSFKTVE